jgi:hypothetical protein
MATLWSVPRTSGAYRHYFYVHHGYGPHDCYFCHKSMTYVEAIHHVDGDHDNASAENLVAAHDSCHKSHHVAGKKQGWASPDYQQSKPRIKCPGCELITTAGPLERHRKAAGH